MEAEYCIYNTREFKYSNALDLHVFLMLKREEGEPYVPSRLSEAIFFLCLDILYQIFLSAPPT